MKRIMIIILTLIMFLSTNITAFADNSNVPKDIKGHWSEKFVVDLMSKGLISGYPDGTFKPNNDIKNAEFLSLILKVMGMPVMNVYNSQLWEDAVINNALEIGLIKSGEPMEVADNLITREQVSLLIYRVLQKKEGVKEYFGQDNYALEHTLTDFDNISDYYMPGVATVFKKGIMNGSESVSADSNYPIRLFKPKDSISRAETSVVFSRLITPLTRATIKEIENKRQTKLLTVIVPEESKNIVRIPFENGKPVIDRDNIIEKLKKTPLNTFQIFFGDTLFWEDYINKEWALDPDIEYKQQTLNDHFTTPIKTMEKIFNVSYKDDLGKYEKELKYFFAETETNKKFIDKHIKQIKEKKLEIEGIVVSDIDLFYSDSNTNPRVKMRLLFRYNSPMKENITVYRGIFKSTLAEDIQLKSNQWYQIDFEGKSAYTQGHGDLWRTWERGETVYYNSWFLSDYIPVMPIN